MIANGAAKLVENQKIFLYFIAGHSKQCTEYRPHTSPHHNIPGLVLSTGPILVHTTTYQDLVAIFIAVHKLTNDLIQVLQYISLPMI